MRPLFRLLATLPALITLPALAGGLDQLKSFIADSHALTADFQQTIAQKSGKTQVASGTMAILRPGRFDWHYNKPYEQRVVGDGKQLWVYDVDLNQVTVKRLDRALGDSPAALLAGSNDLDKRYVLANAASTDGIDWVDATPRNKDSGFDHVRLGFKDNKPVAMDMVDNFGQRTQIRFSNVTKNSQIDTARFTFTPPKGADVVSAD